MPRGRPRKSQLSEPEKPSITELLADRVYERLPYAKTIVRAVTMKVIEEMKQVLLEGGELDMPGFGKMWVKVPTKESVYHHNYLTNQYEYGVARKHVKFKESMTMYRELNGMDYGETLRP